MFGTCWSAHVSLRDALPTRWSHSWTIEKIDPLIDVATKEALKTRATFKQDSQYFSSAFLQKQTTV